MSKLYLVVQQPQYSTDDGATWTGYDWSCRINGAHGDDPTVSLTVDGGGAAVDLLDGMTVLVGSTRYGDWDHGIYRLRGDQSVGPATVALDIGTSPDVRDRVTNNDYVVVLDEFRFWQRYGRIVVAGGDVTWYKDYDIEWDDLGGADATRRLTMMPPVPIMGPHAVKFVDVGGSSADVYFDWSDSYAMAVGEAVASWTSEGESDHAGGTWNSAAETPGDQTFDAISGLRGFRVTLEVDDGNGNATTLPYRRGVRYVFTLRRPGQSQAGDPPNAEPLTSFAVSPISGTFSEGFWRTSITVFEDEADKYQIMPGALVVLFTDDWYTENCVAAPGSIGPLADRENILLVGRIADDSIRIDPETRDVTFDVLSPGGEAELYQNYPVVIEDNTTGTSWIETPTLTPDRAVHYYTVWHTTMNLIADVYNAGDTHPLYAQDFLEGTIYDTINSFLTDRIFGRLLCDKYGRFHCEVDAQMQVYESADLLWTMQDGDWLDEVEAKQHNLYPVNAVEAGGIVYNAGTGAVTPYLSRAPGTYDKYRGRPHSSNSLAINSQAELNTLSGRHLNELNHEFEATFRLAGNWRYLDIAPQSAVDLDAIETGRGTLDGHYLIRAVTFEYDPAAGIIFTAIETEQEMDDGVAGVTIPIPGELPETTVGTSWPDGYGDEAGLPAFGFPPGYPYEALAGVLGHDYAPHINRYSTNIEDSPPTWNDVTASTNKSCLMWKSDDTYRLFGYEQAIYERPVPLAAGAWTTKQTAANIATALGYGGDYAEVVIGRVQFSQLVEGRAWAVGVCRHNAGADVSMFVLTTLDAWDTIERAVEIDDVAQADGRPDLYMSLDNALAIDLHNDTIYALFAKTSHGGANDDPVWWKLYRSQNLGVSFTLAQSDSFNDGDGGRYGTWSKYDLMCDIWVPWASPGVVYWCTSWESDATGGAWGHYAPCVYRSNNYAATKSDISGTLTTSFSRIVGHWNNADRAYALDAIDSNLNNEAVYVYSAGSGWSLFRDMGVSVGNTSQAFVVRILNNYELDTALVGEDPDLLESGSQEDKAFSGSYGCFWLTDVPSA